MFHVEHFTIKYIYYTTLNFRNEVFQYFINLRRSKKITIAT